MPPEKEKKQPLAAWDEAVTLVASLRAFLPLCGLILFNPVVFFRQAAASAASDTALPQQRLGRALLFALVLGYCKLFFDSLNLLWLKYFLKDVPLSPFSFSASPLFLLRPVLILAVTLALVACGIKLILGWDKALVPALFVVCYRSAADLFYALPVVGGVLAFAWSLALLVTGLREAYRVGIFRSLAAGVLMPIFMLLFIFLSLGPVFNRAIFSLYPEMRAQVSRINDVTAYATTSALVSAADTYKKDLGFYPAHLGVLRKYVDGIVLDDALDPKHPSGYIYQYARADDRHFSLEARPAALKTTGSFVFFADETGLIHFDGPAGPVIKDAKEVEQLVLNETKS
jgi:hypothetical protein